MANALLLREDGLFKPKHVGEEFDIQVTVHRDKFL